MMSRYDSQLFKQLEKIQNLPHFQNQDIISITCLMDDEQFKQHVERYIKYVEELEL